MNTVPVSEGIAGTARRPALVAQICNLLYRRLAVCVARSVPATFAFRGSADYRSAIQSCGGSGRYADAICPRSRSSELQVGGQGRAGFLTFERLEKRYGSVQALGGIDLAIERGAILALLGPNGAGKSTLFGCLLGLVRPSGGSIQIERAGVSDAHRARFGYVAERVALYPQRSIRENALFFAGLKAHPAAEVHRQLKRVGLYPVRDRLVRQLSKGMVQRLGVAIALCGQPELLVLDEPFNGLDPALLEGLQRILREEHARGATLLISTHTISAIEPLATDVAILLRGRLAAAGSLKALRDQHPNEKSLECIYHRIARQHHAESPEEILP